MILNIDQRSNRDVVYLGGELGNHDAPALKAALTPLIKADEDCLHRPVVIDMSAVSSITPDIVLALVQLRTMIASCRGAGTAAIPPLLRVIHASPACHAALSKAELLETATGALPLQSHADASGTTILEQVRHAFPAPGPDDRQDAYLTAILARAMEQTNGMKNASPYLGVKHGLDYERARRARIPEDMAEIKNTVSSLGNYFQGMPN